jgi:hypothetical protein
MFGPPGEVARTGGSASSPSFLLQVGGGRVVFLPSEGCVYAPLELDLLFESRRMRVVDSEGRVEHFEARPDPLFEGYNRLVPSSWDGPAPSHEGIRHAVGALVAASRQERAAETNLGPAVQVDCILEQVGAAHER